MPSRDPDLEAAQTDVQVRQRMDAGDRTGATTAAIEGYGPEILGYLHRVAPSAADADDLFSGWCERVWLHLETFRWESALRTWAYAIARNLSHSDYRQRARGREVPLSAAPEVAAMAQAVRSTTAAHLQTAAKDRFAALRQTLDTDDQTLLILRVDRRMGWRDIAQVLADDEDLTKTAARLRKRFERIKDRLRDELAPRSG